MHATGSDVEADAPVGVDTLLEIGDADHDVVDARKHSHSSRARDWRNAAGNLRCLLPLCWQVAL
jgi:hypothetical protein